MDSDVENELDSAMRLLGGSIDTSYYFIDGYTDLYINLQLIAGALLLVYGVGYTWYQKNGVSNVIIEKVGSVVLVAIFLLIGYILFMN